jgi:Tol biopolymer transport system component
VLRRRIELVVLALATVLLCAGNATAAVPAGPQLALLVSHRPGVVSLFGPTLGDSREWQYFLSGSLDVPPVPDPFGVPSWSPDGSRLAFTAYVDERRGPHRVRQRRKIFIADATGREAEPRAVPGTAEGLAPVFAPDGRSIAFARRKEVWRPRGRLGERLTYGSESVWLVDLASGALRQLTPWRNRLYQEPSSFSPDGRTLAVTRRQGSDFGSAVAIDLTSGAESVLASGAREPRYSPDGTRIAYLGGLYGTVKVGRSRRAAALTDLFVIAADGSGMRQLTATPRAIEWAPGWDPSGTHVVYTRIDQIQSPAGFNGVGDSIVDLDLQNGCSRTLFSRPKTVYFGATWRPGPGRVPPPIAC